MRVEDLKAEIDGASAALKSLASRGLIAIEAAPATAHGVVGGGVRSHRRTASRAGRDFTGDRASALRGVSAVGRHRQRQDRNLSEPRRASARGRAQRSDHGARDRAGRRNRALVSRAFRIAGRHRAQRAERDRAMGELDGGDWRAGARDDRSALGDFRADARRRADRRRRGARRVVQKRGRYLLSRARSRGRARGIFEMPGRARLGDAVERVVRQRAARTLPAAAPFAARERSRDGIGRSRRYAARSRRGPQARGGQAYERSGAAAKRNLKRRKFRTRCRSRRRWSRRCAKISRRAARAWCFSTAAASTIFCNATFAAT